MVNAIGCLRFLVNSKCYHKNKGSKVVDHIIVYKNFRNTFPLRITIPEINQATQKWQINKKINPTKQDIFAIYGIHKTNTSLNDISALVKTINRNFPITASIKKSPPASVAIFFQCRRVITGIF